MSKKITVIGTGYVGLIAGIGLADFGNQVTCLDIDQNKIDQLNNGICPIYEPGAEEYIHHNVEAGRLQFTCNKEAALSPAEVIVIAVGTPPKMNGEADLGFIENAARDIAGYLDSYKVIVTKSTVPIGTNRWLKEKIAGLAPGKNFDVVSNPEFLREGRAIQDFFHPDRTVIGYETEKARTIMESVYRALNLIAVPFVWCSLETAELVKYASNSFLATKIAFVNELANLAEAVGADIHQVARTMGMDGRISAKFLHPGPGYGGSCFPKDTRALVATGEKIGVPMSIIRASIESNDRQKQLVVRKLMKLLDGKIENRKIAVLGLAFKQQTDDIRESPSLVLVEKLIAEGASIQAHDPKAMDNFAELYPQVLYCHTSYDTMKEADALVIMTEWNEYRSLDLAKMRKLMKGKVILDTRNLLDPEQVRNAGFVYQGTGRK
ncbi:MAG: UDP-glucose/GDP-mannose dehydrogenase family protein [Spirochaetales bacterium]|nr:UDP-glucose/GDP-mannose dehydrogenase family protein [Spirochaetales bacterium]